MQEKKHQPVLNNLFKKLESIKKQDPGLYIRLTEIMQPGHYPMSAILFEQGEVINKALYVSSGFVLLYYIDLKGKKQVMRIYRPGSIIAGASFMLKMASPYYLQACKGSYLLSLTAGEMDAIYKDFAGTEELARLLVAARELEELERNTLLNQGGADKVQEFYTVYPELRKPGEIVLDADIASYLHMSESRLREHRC
ncbi:Cyclic nucleotide-binding domain-containing protein [bacterium A37T11]|nr:Cyclic nucleotide-binding domain-containing protein [bacterium A37T11]